MCPTCIVLTDSPYDPATDTLAEFKCKSTENRRKVVLYRMKKSWDSSIHAFTRIANSGSPKVKPLSENLTAFRRADSTYTMNPDNTVGVSFSNVLQQFQIWFHEPRPAFADDAEHFRCLHPDLVVAIV